MGDRPTSLLLIDDDLSAHRQLAVMLGRAGYAFTAVPSIAEARRALAAHRPEVVLLDLVLPDGNGFDLLQELRREPATRDLPVVVLTARTDDHDIGHAFSLGADDFVRKPYREHELLARIRGAMRLRSALEESAQRSRDADLVLELTQTLAVAPVLRDALFTVVRRIADVVRVERCSLVVARDRHEVAFVITSSDDESLQDLPIRLDRYPEIGEALAQGRTLYFEDALSHPIFAAERSREGGPRHTQLTVVPVLHERWPLGVLFLRSSSRGPLDPRETALCQTLANALAVSLRNARELELLHGERQAVTAARSETERTLQRLQTYADLFESAAEGMLVVDHEGRVVFANPRAESITGYTADEMRAGDIHRAVLPDDHARLRAILEGFRRLEFPVDVDIRVMRKDGAPRTISMNTSPVLHDSGAALVTFRDVTAERQTARELAKTEEFLASLIESSPDAILAATLDGEVLLLNPAAERILGYRRDEVVGRVSANALHPDGTWREILRRLRESPDGRLIGYRAEVVSRDGERVPTLLAVALVGAAGAERATVTVFSDLRDRVRMEQRLAQVQNQLAQSERQALLAELAGAAAHELNQPLTAIQGYAEILLKIEGPDSRVGEKVGVILREAERMAKIVRDIGHITRYETKQYVGSAQIIDLDRSTRESSDPPPESPP